MPRSLRPVALLLVFVCASVTVLSSAHAEQSGSRVIILPLRGPGGVIARNEIAKAIAPNLSYVRKIGAQGAQRPARTARMHKADAMIGGRVRCPNRGCIVDVLVYRRTGQVWTKGTKRATRATVGPVAAELCESLLADIGLGTGGGGGQEDDVDVDDDIDDDDFEPVDDDDDYDDDRRRRDDDDDYDDDRRRRDDDDDRRRRRRRDDDYDDDRRRDDDDDDRRRRRRRDDDDDDYDDDDRGGRQSSSSDEHDFDALEIFFDADLTLARNLCLDLNPEGDSDSACDLQQPGADDRTYSVSPYINLGFRLSVFPGAFIDRRAWWAHWGLWADYGHSISVTSQREYRTPTDETYTEEIPTVQQDFRIGLMYRLAIPYNQPTGVQIRFMAGFGFYEFSLDDTTYPLDSDIHQDYRSSNPYLPTFKYTSFDVGLQLRIPILGFIFPYTNFFYRATLGSGQADRIYGDLSSINGIDWELAVAVELGLGIRIQAGIELIWYQTVFAGEFAPEDEEERSIWEEGNIAGDTATDLVFRLRLGIGWAF